MKKLILHIGHGKTGTSAIQSFCARHQDKLKTHGVDYPHHSSFDIAIDGKVTSGNINPRQEGWLQALEKAVRLSSEDKILFSNEDMFHIIARDWAQFSAFAKKINTEIILFVRDPVEMLLSSYGQAVKRGGHTGTLEDFWPTEQHTAKASRVLQMLQDEGISTIVRNYSVHKKGVTEALLRCFLDDVEAFRDDFDMGTINRSLTNGELAFQMAFNRHFGKASARFVSDVLVTELPEVEAEHAYLSHEAFEAFTDPLADAIAHLNKSLPKDEQIVILDYDTYHFAPSDQNVQLTPEQIDVVVAAISKRIKDAEEYFDGIEAFDPKEYFRLNPDLRARRPHPFQHFIKHGIRERRPYKKSS